MAQDDNTDGPAKDAPVEGSRITDHPAWITLASFLAVMAALLALYGRMVPTADALIAMMLVAGAAVIGGALIGFLFGVPRRRT